MSEDACANCGQPIIYKEAPADLDPAWSYWTHRNTQSNWCYMTLGDYLELPLDTRDTKAEPRE